MDTYFKYAKEHKKLLAILMALVAAVLLFWLIDYTQKANREYFINAPDSINVECKAHIWQGTAKCDPSEIVGTFSNYDDLEFRAETGGTVTNIDENNFTVWEDGYISYQYEQFNPDDLKQGYKSYTTLRLRGGKHHEAFATKVIEFRYSFSEEDVQLFSSKYSEWKAAEDKRRAQEEADKKAEEDRKAQEAEKKTEQPQESAQEADSQDNYKMPDDISIYDIKELCERHAESKGYPNAEIKTSTLQGTDMENGKYYKVSGTLYIDEGWTSAERSVGEYACTADYTKWQVTTAYLNRQSL